MGKKHKRRQVQDKWEQRYEKALDRMVFVSWYNLDTAIADLVIRSCDRYISERHGVMFAGGDPDDYDWNLADKATGYVYEVLRELALDFKKEYGDDDNGFFDALSECARLGYLWD